MAVLSSELRRLLESTIREARRVAEAGARRALEALAVDRDEPHASMTQAEITLRNRLRAHGRQLGDARDREQGAQEIRRLAHEVAYEHWHRMLFARFLVENQLLIEPESGVAISMAECEELARERGVDPWTFAGRAAARMLPRIFRPEDPVLEVTLAPETSQALEKLLASLPVTVFTADDSLGWTYQFWQSERKDEVNRSGVKIGADELPAVTQLFTEHYMVQFLFHNTIGAWRAGKVLARHGGLAESASSEEELRRTVRLQTQGGYDFSYLRFVRAAQEGDEEGKPAGPWRPAAGAFETWPQRAAELRILDPCCGSGHFLVEGLELLVRLRMEEDGLALAEAIRAVVAENLFGLEIDPRCTQIAAFNLALAAWKLAGKSTELPPLQIACSGLEVGASGEEWARLAPDDDPNLKLAMRWLHDEFRNARELGSLLDPSKSAAAKLAPWKDLQPLLARALEREDIRRDPEALEAGIAAQGLAQAAELLAGQFTLVATNVPYLKRGNQAELVREHCARFYRDASGNLACAMLDRCLRFAKAGTVSLVVINELLTLGGYSRLRKRLLQDANWAFLARLGPGAFEEVGGEIVNVCLLMLSPSKTDAENTRFSAVDTSGMPSPGEKRATLSSRDVLGLDQRVQLSNPDARIVLVDVESTHRMLSETVSAGKGSTTGDSPHYLRCFWESPMVGKDRVLWLDSPTSGDLWSGRSLLLNVRVDDPGLLREAGCMIRGQALWGRIGVAVTKTGQIRSLAYAGEVFDDNVGALCPHDPQKVGAVLAFVESPEYTKRIRAIDQTLKVTAATLGKVPFDLTHWQKVAAEKYPDGLAEPQSDDPTQWLFHGHPAKAEPHAALQVAVARLLGYRWPPEQDPGMRLAAEAREWMERCRALDGFADQDGIVCLTPARGEAGAADRLRRLNAAAFGSDWSAAKERGLLMAAAAGGTPAGSLEEWLRDCFFEEHCALFHHRPLVWHVWDGRRDGFHALVSYHHLAGPGGEGRRTLEALAYSYLGDWIERQRAEQREGKPGADARLAAALDLQAQLARILEGEPPCDLFVRWKPLHRQPIGWEPDLDDGVRLNIRPFMKADLCTGGRRGAGILRCKPNIKWTRDRGQEPESLRPREDFPWFWSCPGDGSPGERIDFKGGPAFDGNRWNDLHYTNASKRVPRERAVINGRGNA